MHPPTVKRSKDTTKDQKYNSLPYPKGRFASALFLLRFIPHKSKSWLMESITEWMPSEIIAELPVNDAATNFIIAIAISAAKAT